MGDVIGVGPNGVVTAEDVEIHAHDGGDIVIDQDEERPGDRAGVLLLLGNLRRPSLRPSAMTTREAVAVPRAETKKPKLWSWVRRAAAAVVPPALLAVAVIAHAVVFARSEEGGSPDGFRGLGGPGANRAAVCLGARRAWEPSRR